MSTPKWQLALTLVVGAIGGLLIANLNLFRPATATPSVRSDDSSPTDQTQATAKQPINVVHGPNGAKTTFVAAADPAAVATQLAAATASQAGASKPNILVIWGDDIGVHNISAYNHGIMGYKNPQHRSHRQGRARCSPTATPSKAARPVDRPSSSASIRFRTGLLTIGMPGSDHGIPDWAPTIGDLLKEQGYATAQFGKNHLGDRDKHSADGARLR